MRSLPRIVSSIPSDLRNFLDRVREYLSEGDENRFVTLKELRVGGIVGTTPGGTITKPPVFGVDKPHVPTGLITTGSLGTIILTWDPPNYLGHSHTEIWASATNDFTTKELIGTAEGTEYTDAVGSGLTRYYWIRFVNKEGVAGPFNSEVGTAGTAGQDPAYLLEVLAGAITDAELSTALNTQIDTNTTQITNVRNLYTVKMDNQGYLAGFGLMSTLSEGGAPTSDFFINANRFAITAPLTSVPTRQNSTAYAVGAAVGVVSSTSKMLVAKTAGTTSTSAPNISSTAIGTLVTDGSVVWQVASRVPFAVLSTPATFGGVSFNPGVYIDGASIVNATITTATIGDAAITTAKIANTIQSTNYSSTQGWQINKSGTATFNEVNVRGTIQNGTAALSGTTMTGSGAFINSTGTFALGNATTNITFNGTTLTLNGDVVDTPQIKDNAVSRPFVGSISEPVAINDVTGVDVSLPSITIPTGLSGRLVVTISYSIHNFSTSNAREVQAESFVNGEARYSATPIMRCAASGTNSAFVGVAPLNTTSGTSQQWTEIHELNATSGATYTVELYIVPSATVTNLYLIDAIYSATLYQK